MRGDDCVVSNYDDTMCNIYNFNLLKDFRIAKEPKACNILQHNVHTRERKKERKRKEGSLLKVYKFSVFFAFVLLWRGEILLFCDWLSFIQSKVSILYTRVIWYMCFVV